MTTASAHKLIANSDGTSLEIPMDDLGAAGAPSALFVCAEFQDDIHSDAERLQDVSLRAFQVEVQLTKSLSLPEHVNGAFGAEDGGSLIQPPPGIVSMTIQTSTSPLELAFNDRREISMIRTRVNATTATVARDLAHDAFGPVLDVLAFMAPAPVLTGVTRIFDETNQVTMIEILGPDRPVTLNPGALEVFADLAPVYALYREFKNSSSAFYRMLCLYKILEGIFGVLRKKARREARNFGIDVTWPKERVPNHPELSAPMRAYVDMPIADFFARVLQKDYRDVVAHFLVRDTVMLQPGSSAERQRFTEMAFLADLCVRVVVMNHEHVLRQIQARQRQT